jgi:mannosyltransferase
VERNNSPIMHNRNSSYDSFTYEEEYYFRDNFSESQRKIVRDNFYWPKRIFDRVNFRSKLLAHVYGASKAKIFHSTYFTTIKSPVTRKFVTVHDMIYEIFESQAPSKWAKQVLYNKRKTIEEADMIVCVSESTKKDLLKFFPLLSEEKISVIYSGISSLNQNSSNIALSDIALKYGHQFSANSYFLLVGKLDGYKNFKLIIDLLDQNQNARNFKFLSVGSGKNSKMSTLALRNHPENFFFIDFVTDEELAVLYRNAIGLVYPSRYEGFGLPVLEAMANSCPVACSYSSSLPEVGGNAAIYFDPSSTAELFRRLVELISCDRHEVISRGLAHASKFSWENTVTSLLGLYQ